MTPDGIHYGIPESVYRADPAYSYSRVKLATGTMAEYREAMLNPKPPSEAMIVGTLIDSLMFGSLAGECVLKPEPRAPNGWRDEVLKSGKYPVAKENQSNADGCAAALNRHPVASRFLKSPGASQVSMFITHEGVRLKARIDRVPAKSTALVDLKKCQDASPGRIVTREDGSAYEQLPKWSYDMRDFCYHMQAGLYLWMWNKLAGTEDRREHWVHVCVEEKPPHLVNVFQMGQRSIDDGEKLFFDTLAKIRACEASGEWPGYPEEVTVAEVAK